jgi:hypothetical protein
MALTHHQTALEDSTDAVAALVNAFVSPFLLLLDAAIPNGNVLCALAMNATPFGAANASGVATANAIANGVCTAAAGVGVDTTHWAIVDGSTAPDGNAMYIQGTIGEAADGADIEINNKTLIEDQIVQVTSFTYAALPQ